MIAAPSIPMFPYPQFPAHHPDAMTTSSNPLKYNPNVHTGIMQPPSLSPTASMSQHLQDFPQYLFDDNMLRMSSSSPSPPPHLLPQNHTLFTPSPTPSPTTSSQASSFPYLQTQGRGMSPYMASPQYFPSPLAAVNSSNAEAAFEPPLLTSAALKAPSPSSKSPSSVLQNLVNDLNENKRRVEQLTKQIILEKQSRISRETSSRNKFEPELSKLRHRIKFQEKRTHDARAAALRLSKAIDSDAAEYRQNLSAAVLRMTKAQRTLKSLQTKAKSSKSSAVQSLLKLSSLVNDKPLASPTGPQPLPSSVCPPAMSLSSNSSA